MGVFAPHPPGDILQAIHAGQASIVTDHIDRFVPEGIRLASGQILEADIVISATGLILKPAGGLALTVDGEPVDIGQQVLYRGVLLSGAPNYGNCFGYTSASWTLRADLASRYVCRFLNHLDAHGYAYGVPAHPGGGELKPQFNLTSTYVAKAARLFPKVSDHGPWQSSSFYPADCYRMRRADLAERVSFVAHASKPRATVTS